LKERLRERKAALNVVSLQRALEAALENLDRLVQHNPGGSVRPGGSPEAHGQVLT